MQLAEQERGGLLAETALMINKGCTRALSFRS